VRPATVNSVTEEMEPKPGFVVGSFSASSAASNDPVGAQAGWLQRGRLQSAQRQALATRIGQTQGNRHLQRVVTSLNGLPHIQRSDPEEGQSATWRMARPGETYHGLKAGWPPLRTEAIRAEHGATLGDTSSPTAEDLEQPASSVPAESFSMMRTLIGSPEISRMLLAFGSGMEIVVHVVSQIHDVAQPGETAVRTQHRGETLRPGEASRAPASEIHVALTQPVVESRGQLRTTFSHELLHATVAIPSAGWEPRGRGSRRGLPAHPRELVDMLVHPQRGLAGQLGWPSDWDPAYRFGWYEDPTNGVPRHLDNEVTFHSGVSALLEESSTSPRIRQRCERLQSVRQGHQYESGFRTDENPEEDLAESFERYMTAREELRDSHPYRFALLDRYFHS